MTKCFDLETSTQILIQTSFVKLEIFDSYTIGKITCLVGLETEHNECTQKLVKEIYELLIREGSIKEEEFEEIYRAIKEFINS